MIVFKEMEGFFVFYEDIFFFFRERMEKMVVIVVNVRVFLRGIDIAA